ncbi:GtrA family protein [Spirillospora sp. CA-294931]|uniref:GtrA family protein n=1 Tax=Spirillospora sp. CA-294931 TaxID=3240042 RepID=UPI003D8C4BC7
MSTLQRPRPVRTDPVPPHYRTYVRELLTFGTVGFLGTVITIGGANLMRTWLGGSPLLSVVVPTMISTMTSYLLHRYWTFAGSASDGSGREVAVFFGLNGVGMLIQVVCTGFTYYTLGLHGGLAYNMGLLVGLAFASAFRYWSYKKWVFTPATA